MFDLSIIVICYNQGQQLNALLRSLNEQSCDLECFEVILVDDGSTPRIVPLLKTKPHFAFTTLYLERDEHSGRARARNAGAKLAKGKHLLFLDGDAIVNPQLVERYLRYFSIHKTRRVVIGTRTELTQAQSHALLSSTEEPLLASFFEGDNESDTRLAISKQLDAPFADILGNWVLFASCNFCIEKSSFDKIGGFNEDFVGWGLEDTEFAYRLSQQNIRCDLMDNRTRHFFYLPTQEHISQRYQQWLNNIELFYSLYKDPAILQLMQFDPVIYDCFLTNKGWNEEVYQQAFLRFNTRLIYLYQGCSYRYD